MKRMTFGVIGLVLMIWMSSLSAVSQTVNNIMDVHKIIRDALNAHDMTPAMPYLADDFKSEHSWNNIIDDAQGFVAGLEAMFAAYPDLAFLDGLTLQTDNIIFDEHGMQGTFMNQYGPFPPTGIKGPPMMHIDVWDFDGLKTTRKMSYADMSFFMIDAGMLPPPTVPSEPSFAMPAPEPTGLSPVEASNSLASVWNAHDLISWLKMFTEDADLYISAFDQKLSLTQVAAIMEKHFAGFPDEHISKNVRQIDFGDGWILEERLVQGTHKGEWFGIPPTGKTSASLKVADILRFNSDGLCTYYHSYYDNLTVLANLGLIPTSSAEEWELYQ